MPIHLKDSEDTFNVARFHVCPFNIDVNTSHVYVSVSLISGIKDIVFLGLMKKYCDIIFRGHPFKIPTKYLSTLVILRII